MAGIVFAGMLVAGCASTTVSQVEVQQAIQITDPDKVKPIAITKVAAKIRRGTDIGDLQAGWLCVKNDDIKWRSGNKVQMSNEDLVDVFREELEANGWPVVGSTENLFDGYDVSGAEVLVAARISDIEANMCALNAGFGDWQYDRFHANGCGVASVFAGDTLLNRQNRHPRVVRHQESKR